MDYTITKNHDGSVTISTIYDGVRRHKQYFGYTEKQAESLFHQSLIKCRIERVIK